MPDKPISDEDMIAALKGEGDDAFAREVFAVIQSDLRVKLNSAAVTEKAFEEALIESYLSILPPDRS